MTIGAGLLMVLVGAAVPQGKPLQGASQSGKAADATSAPAPSADFSAEASAITSKYCVTCHNQRLKSGGLMFDVEGVTNVPAHAEVWEKVIRKVKSGSMPPFGSPKPDNAVLTTWVSGLERTLDRAAAAVPNPGRVAAIHRLNRTEYPNVIRDLLAIDIDSAAMLPVEDAGYGFDNVADVLQVSPTLMERYVLAAAKVSRLAMGVKLTRPTAVAYMNSPLLWQEDRVSEDLPLGSRGGIAVRHNFPTDGEYEINIRIPRKADYSQYVKDLAGTEPLEVRVDYERVKLIQPQKVREDEGADTYNETPLSFRVPIKAGPHLLGIDFVADVSHRLAIDVRPPRPSLTSFFFQQIATDPQVLGVQIVGPFQPGEAGDTPSRHRILACHPSTPAQEDPCARQILTTLVHRAYRGMDTPADVDKLMAAYKTGRTTGDFEHGIEWALEALLVQPGFLFRVEHDPATARPGVPYRISDLELASRLSFFLWSSIPDDELLAVAKQGKLSDPLVLQQQVKRMLADPKSSTLATNFANQWLGLRKLAHVTPDPYLFPNFDDNLRQAMGRETELFFESQVRENHSVTDLLTANYTFVNEQLAKHYGLPEIYGDHFRRVTLTDPRRFGLMGQASILTVSSYANRTSPVQRGKWLLENVLGTPPPPPPPNVPSLKENGEGLKATTVRARLEEHRKNPVCAACHRNMDPLGFALDNFDAIGQWRTVDAESKDVIDSSGTMSDGSKFDGPIAFRTILLSRREQFVETVVEKLFTYGLGRGTEYYDRPAIRQVLHDAAQNDYRWSSIILGIVRSKPFEMRTAAPAALSASNVASGK
jgi:mono/diheme cytochrome c family protein